MEEPDGYYVDSILAAGSMGDLEDFAQDHFPFAHTPLTFSLQNAQPVVASQMAQYDFLNWLSGYLHDRDKKVMGNIFAVAYRYYAHLLDILGSEIFNVTESDRYAAIRRVLCYHKVNTNLLQWFRGDDFLDHEEVKQYIKGQLFWGFFPVIATAGGGLGVGQTLERYFLHPELYERDRSLFKTYLPIINKLAKAGWEPITYAETDNSSILIERFGTWDGSKVYFTLKNDEDTTQTAMILIDLADLNIPPSDWDELKGTELISDTALPLNVDVAQEQVSLHMTFVPHDIRAIEIYFPSSALFFIR